MTAPISRFSLIQFPLSCLISRVVKPACLAVYHLRALPHLQVAYCVAASSILNVSKSQWNKSHAGCGCRRGRLLTTINFRYVHKNHKFESSLMGSSDAVEPYAGGYTYHQIILIVSAVTTTLCLIFSVSLASVHLSNWVKPKEQKQ